MRKPIALFTLFIALAICGCGAGTRGPGVDAARMNGDSTEHPDGTPPADAARMSGVSTELPDETRITQGGPYGQISLSLPDGWICEACPVDSETLTNGMYGLRFRPADAKEGYIELAYVDSFGVCGTGLSEQETTIAGHPAYIGTYDNHAYWDFIAFAEEYDGLVATTVSADGWQAGRGGEIAEILETVSFDQNIREGGAYLFRRDSEAPGIGLQLSLKHISPTGATLVFYRYDPDAPSGELQYGDAFLLEMQKDGEWEEVPIAAEGNYAFHMTSYIIPREGGAGTKLDWEWLYGALAPGEYRIRKNVNDFRGTGDYDTYTLYAYFILN